jgi:hypothetical protein
VTSKRESVLELLQQLADTHGRRYRRVLEAKEDEDVQDQFLIRWLEAKLDLAREDMFSS